MTRPTKRAGDELNLSTFQPKHLELLRMGADPSVRNILAAGGIRSGKTIALMSSTFLRALRAPGSIHGIFHAQRNVCKRNLFDGTFPETLEILLPGWYSSLKADKRGFVDLSDLEVTLPNGSKFMFLGLDDPEKIRGLRFNTILLNEANQVDFQTVSTLRGRLSQETPTLGGGVLETKMFFDLNPTTKTSWDYQVFVEGVVPGERKPIPNHATNYRWISINAIDNAPNLPASLFEDFEAMTEAQRRRDEFGLWAEDNPNALFNAKTIGRKTIDPDDCVEVVVSIDPAGTANASSDSTGIIVAGKCENGSYYVLEDATMKAKPDVWLTKAEELRVKYDANWIVSEKDYARDILVELAARVIPDAPIKYVESRGRKKRLRAEPIAALYEKGLVNHVGRYADLETQMVEFDSPGFKGSPDRVDALVYALQHLSGVETGPSKFATGKAVGFWTVA